jgi:hypothetical protein
MIRLVRFAATSSFCPQRLQDRELAVDAAHYRALKERFLFQQGIGLDPFIIVSSLCGAVANGGEELWRGIAKFRSSGADKQKVLRFIRDIFFLLVEEESGTVCALRAPCNASSRILDQL